MKVMKLTQSFNYICSPQTETSREQINTSLMPHLQGGEEIFFYVSLGVLLTTKQNVFYFNGSIQAIYLEQFL